MMVATASAPPTMTPPLICVIEDEQVIASAVAARLRADGFSVEVALDGPEGVALFYVSRRPMERVKPTLVGWLTVYNPEDYLNYDQPYAPSARRFEAGALNTAGVAGLGAAIELFLQIGLEKIESHLLDLGDFLCERLRERLNDRGYRVASSRRSA